MTNCFFCNSKLDPFPDGSALSICSNYECYHEHKLVVIHNSDTFSFNYHGTQLHIYPKVNETVIVYNDRDLAKRKGVKVPMAFDPDICSIDSFLERAEKLAAFG